MHDEGFIESAHPVATTNASEAGAHRAPDRGGDRTAYGAIAGPQHAAALQRVFTAMAQLRESMNGRFPQPRLRDVFRAKAEILLSSEEAEAIRHQIK